MYWAGQNAIDYVNIMLPEPNLDHSELVYVNKALQSSL